MGHIYAPYFDNLKLIKIFTNHEENFPLFHPALSY